MDGHVNAFGRNLRDCTGPLAIYDSVVADPSAGGDAAFLQSLMDTELYSIGAYFCDEHPDLVDELVTRSAEIESQGLTAYAGDGDGALEEAFETLLTGLAVRYYKALAG
jgi:hypothetical protein